MLLSVGFQLVRSSFAESSERPYLRCFESWVKSRTEVVSRPPFTASVDDSSAVVQ